MNSAGAVQKGVGWNTSAPDGGKAKFPSENHIFCIYSVQKERKGRKKVFLRGYSGNVDAQSVNFLFSLTAYEQDLWHHEGSFHCVLWGLGLVMCFTWVLWMCVTALHILCYIWLYTFIWGRFFSGSLCTSAGQMVKPKLRFDESLKHESAKCSILLFMTLCVSDSVLKMYAS